MKNAVSCFERLLYRTTALAKVTLGLYEPLTTT